MYWCADIVESFLFLYSWVRAVRFVFRRLFECPEQSESDGGSRRLATGFVANRGEGSARTDCRGTPGAVW